MHLLDLAPGGVYLATPVTWRAGALLPHLFTLTREAGGLFSVALSRRSPWVAVSNHRALWSPDFPRRAASSQHGIGSSSPRPPSLLGRCLLYLRAGSSPKTPGDPRPVLALEVVRVIDSPHHGFSLAVELHDGQSRQVQVQGAEHGGVHAQRVAEDCLDRGDVAD